MAVYGGLIIGAIYDLFWFLRLVFPGKLAVNVLDFLFYAVGGAVFAILNIVINGGELRLYIFVGAFSGFFLYWRFIGFYIRKRPWLLHIKFKEKFTKENDKTLAK